MTIVADPIPATLPEVAPLETVLGVMPETIAVVVRPEHIARGKPGAAYSCAIALAFEEQGFRASVSYCEACVGGVLYSVDRMMSRWLRAFDKGSPVAPERFVLHRVKK